ncbi:MAG: hypothetical protein ACYS32_03670 [Planctomycetota bacterium]|jgi:Tol biopolymer transport system component
MNNRKVSFGLATFYVAAMFLVGCIPDDSLQWSEDGSVGLFRIDEGLYIVDGNSGELTEVEKPYVCMLPDISDDGKLIAYSLGVQCSNSSESLKDLPAGQVKMIKYYAEEMRKNILSSGGLTDGKFPFPEEGLLLPQDYRGWAIRYLCENADDELLEVLGKEGIEKGKGQEFGYFRIVVVPSKDPDKKRIVTTSVFNVMALQLSPNGKYLAYLMHTQRGEVSNSFEEFALFVSCLENDANSVFIDHPVAIGYDWRPDSKAIAYIKADSEDLQHDNFIVGTLEERVVADANDNLLAKSIELGEEGSAGTYDCIGESSQLAGVIFYPWVKVVYGAGRRLFFTSAVLTLPTSTRDEAGWSIFCYDPVTNTVTDVLGASVSSYSNDALGTSQFDLSPDGKNVLLPMSRNRFLIYRFGDGLTMFPIEESEGFGEDNVSALFPAWKGNDEISCMVSEKSHFLTEDKEEPHKRKEMVILGADGNFRRILSESWPDMVDK